MVSGVHGKSADPPILLEDNVIIECLMLTCCYFLVSSNHNSSVFIIRILAEFDLANSSSTDYFPKWLPKVAVRARTCFRFQKILQTLV